MTEISARFELFFSLPHTHYADVTATIEPRGRESIDLMMAVWTPGSYLVREYAKNVEGFTARTRGGDRLESRKTRKNRWTVSCAGVDSFVVVSTYRSGAPSRSKPVSVNRCPYWAEASADRPAESEALSSKPLPLP